MFFIPPLTYQILKTKRKGRGVFAAKNIKKETVIGEYSGEFLPYHKISEQDYPFLMYFNDGVGVVADKNKVGVHLLNHSCDPNCAMQPSKSLMTFVAKRDIESGEELTVSYMYPPQSTCTNCKHICYCDSLNCLGTMHAPDKEYDLWQKFLKNSA